MSRFFQIKQYRCLQAGVTFIELLVVLAVIGILAAIAYPSYTEHLQRSYREDAKTGLVKLQLWMEEQYNTNGSYPASVNNSSCPGCSLNTNRYNFSATRGNGADTYVLTATPKTSGDRCGILSLNAAGLGSAKLGGSAVSGCW
ncbi:type IV pilin protein [Photobacterium sp. TY1-4]|uniref:type IV pilin protein n=1 Tax=Photobacterium sp. TY1-4 TaxID=2899122 RepID=UPI0021C073C0|nr:type IV pilin protein [Photobacterium sp. TY1-4]UXI00757.1 type IV pilin protein [Photobacterium sp. TY1-4]